MTYLKINNTKAEYLDENKSWQPINQIDKKGLLYLVNQALGSNKGFEMDDPDQHDIPNEAHKIIYENIYNKLKEVIENKESINNEILSLYKAEYEKYSVTLEEDDDDDV